MRGPLTGGEQFHPFPFQLRAFPACTASNLPLPARTATYQLFMIPRHAVLCPHAVRAVQAYEGADEAQKLAGFYKLFELPALLIIDPVTGTQAALRL